MQPECIDIYSQLESWYATDRGQYLLDSTRPLVQNLLETSFGYHLLHLGVHGKQTISADSPIRHRIYSAAQPGAGVDLVANAQDLPLESDSVDAIIVHHCLEFAANPHQVLREIQRVLTPQGHLVIVGFNPYSLLGINARARGLLRHSLWRNHRAISEHRLRDWLRLLGCEVQSGFNLASLPPAGHGKIRRWMTRCDIWATKYNLPVGGIYVLLATKQVVGMHPQRRKRRHIHSDRLIGLVPRPAPTPSSSLPQRRGPLMVPDIAA